MIKEKILSNTNLYIRVVLAFTFLGHGLVSLGFSPSIKLHENLIESINIFNVNSVYLLNIQACFDIIISFLLMINFRIKQVIYIVLIYLFFVSISALSYYSSATGSIFGIAECFRRFPWILFALFIISDFASAICFKFLKFFA